jgi:hypothetical protein
MPPSLPPDPHAHSDKAIYDVYIANRASAALSAAHRLGIFRLVADRSRSLEELCKLLKLERRPLDALLTVLVSLGLLRREGEGADGLLATAGGVRYAPTRLVRDHLLPGSPFYIGGLLDLESQCFVTPSNLIEAMHRNAPGVYGETDPWEKISSDPQAAADFTRAMHSVSIRPAFALVATFDFSSIRSLLDVAGGSGILAIAAALRNPGLRATVLELPAVADVAHETVADYRLSDRISIATGNMFAGPLPAGHDAILFSQIFHDWAPETARLLLAKACDALPAKGRVLIHEKLLDDDRDGPLATALVSLDMLFWTEGRQYTASELHMLLDEEGFVAPRTMATVDYWSVTWAQRP